MIPQHLVPLTLSKISSAWTKVWAELEYNGFSCNRLARCEVKLGYVSGAYGYQFFGDRERGKVCGDIVLPSISWSHWVDYFRGKPKTSAVDILRHECGHAYADVNRHRIETKKFERIFRYPHDVSYESPMEYDPKFHVTQYAAASTGEDFAETFWLYLKHKGNLPRKLQTCAIIKKWKFIDSLRKI